MLSHEHTINTSLGEVLNDRIRGWRVSSEQVGGVFEDGGRPDILIEKIDGWPIVLEAEVGNYRQAESDARSRVGMRLLSTGEPIHAAIALVYPNALRHHNGADLRKALTEIPLEYALLSVESDGSISRFPKRGWICSTVSELVVLMYRSSIPSWRVEELADALELGVIQASGHFSARHPHGSALGQRVASLLGQSDDNNGQTRRMAMTVVIDALVFHAALATAEMTLKSKPIRNVKSPAEFRSKGTFRPTQLSDEWELILDVNYWPIFHTAGEIVRILPTQDAASIIDILWATAERLIAGGVTKSHDLTGVVFQRLIADRKFLATYYTRPSGAALLAGLAIPIKCSLVGSDWEDQSALASVRIGDFACGTGTLLSTAYQRVGLLHEIHGGDAKALHPIMMERGLVGLDVLTVAVHLTAAMLAGSHPSTPFDGECLLTMPYGKFQWGECLGSLDLLSKQTSFEIMQEAAETAGGRGAKGVRNLIQQVGHEQFELVIMNPPFTRHGAREGDRTNVHNPAFAAFGAEEEEQNLLSRHLRRLGTGGHAHGHAGLASYFVDLAHRKTAKSGRLALVLPLTSMSGKSWDRIRALLRSEYSSAIIVTIAEKGSHTRSFSADTGMAECLFIAQKEKPHSPGTVRAKFVVLNAQPRDTLDGEQLAHAISRKSVREDVRRLEDGPFGGTRIEIGDTSYGEILDCPLPAEGPWQMVGISDITLGQSAHQMAGGRLWVEGMTTADIEAIPVVAMSDVIERIGPHDLDIAGSQIKADGLPQGPFERIPGITPGAAYPCLWNHDAKRERRLIVNPDSHCQVREVRGEVPSELIARAELRWATAARAHYNRDVRFNSQSLIVALTEQPCIGGRAWPTVILKNVLHEFSFAIWCNSTLGLLCHWWMANKSQEGRGTSTISSIPKLNTLDLRELTAEQHAAAKVAFESMAEERFLPFDQIDNDPARAELDRRLIVDILGLSAEHCVIGGPMHRLRTKLAAEPQIRSNKRTRVVFTETGESSVAREAS